MNRKTIIFLLYCLFIGIFISFCFINKKLNNIKTLESAFKINKDINTLIVGDSHPMTSLDPEIIEHSKNVSFDSENYFFTYYKLKYLLLFNSHIKVVILGFTPENISKINVEMFLLHEPKEKQLLDRYYKILDDEGKNKIKSFRKYFILYFLKNDLGIPIGIYENDVLIKTLLNMQIEESDYNMIGGFYNSDNSNVNIQDIRQKIKEYFYNDNGIYPGKSVFNIEYLYKIMDLCSRKGIKVYLYRSNVFPMYKQLIPKESINDYEQVKQDILQKFTNAKYIHFSNLNNIDKIYFGDGDHLNRLGAKVVSNLMNDVIKESNNMKF